VWRNEIQDITKQEEIEGDTLFEWHGCEDGLNPLQQALWFAGQSMSFRS
jgi:hypothetical protein